MAAAGAIAGAVVAAVIVSSAIGALVYRLWPRNPVVKVEEMSITGVSVHVTTKLGLPVLSLDLSLRLRVRAQNPNYMPVSYSAATVAIYYDGTKIGESNMGAGQFMPRDNKVMELSATMSALELAAANAQRLLSDMVNRSVTVEAVTSFPAVAHGLCDSLHPRLLVELRNEVTFDPLTLGVQESDSFSAMQLLQPITHPS